MTEPKELDRIRCRWRDHHVKLGLPEASSRRDVTPAGLARRVQDLSSRILILPADPLSTVVEFDEDFWAWWTEQRPAPFEASLSWHPDVATADAAVRTRKRGDHWDTYLAVHRHGGVEIGTDDAGEVRGARCFRLIRTVGLLWIALDTQPEVLRHVDVGGPWEVTLTMYGTEGAYLGGLGVGWESPDSIGGFAPTCPEPNVVIREELDDWPEASDELRDLAFRLGGRIEDAWGVKERRFLDGRGEHEGEFNSRRWRL